MDELRPSTCEEWAKTEMQAHLLCSSPFFFFLPLLRLYAGCGTTSSLIFWGVEGESVDYYVDDPSCVTGHPNEPQRTAKMGILPDSSYSRVAR